MKATEANLLEFIKKSNQFSIPIYQRLYSWTENECERLWDDIITTGSKNIPSHFIGNELNDPRELCRDVSQTGHWGNGEVELILSSEEDITYVISLVRQAIEKQYGNEESL